jgi:hypothetical protein
MSVVYGENLAVANDFVAMVISWRIAYEVRNILRALTSRTSVLIACLEN